MTETFTMQDFVSDVKFGKSSSESKVVSNKDIASTNRHIYEIHNSPPLSQ